MLTLSHSGDLVVVVGFDVVCCNLTNPISHLSQSEVSPASANDTMAVRLFCYVLYFEGFSSGKSRMPRGWLYFFATRHLPPPSTKSHDYNGNWISCRYLSFFCLHIFVIYMPTRHFLLYSQVTANILRTCGYF